MSKAKKMEDGLFAWSLGYWRSLLTLAQNLPRDWTKAVGSICGGIREASDAATVTPAFKSASLFLSTK